MEASVQGGAGGARTQDLIATVAAISNSLMNEVSKVIIGKNENLRRVTVGILSNGNMLLEDFPGLAKTLLANTFARALGCKFKRVQFTPDLLPSDIMGTYMYDQKSGEFKLRAGPLFSNILLADEINRAPPKTQAALLEAMEEKQVTIEGITHKLPAPFVVLATQNPIEQEGTYPLPEAQLDRFMFSLNITYPSREDEIEIVKSTTSGSNESLKSTITKDDILTFQSLVRRVPVADNVVEFAVDLASKTRPEDGAPQFISDWLEWGAGPRASQYLILGAKAKAILDGRPTPDISDVITMAKPVLRHRIITNFNAEADGVNADQVLDQLIQKSA